jgi:hypothetical protein
MANYQASTGRRKVATRWPGSPFQMPNYQGEYGQAKGRKQIANGWVVSSTRATLPAPFPQLTNEKPFAVVSQLARHSGISSAGPGGFVSV